MNQAKKLLFGFALAALAAIAIAKTWGPFMMSLYDARATSIQADIYEQNIPSGNIARFFLNIGVAKIKKGDMVRIIFADGTVYDFEAASQCSPTGTVSCQWTKWTQRSSATAPAIRSQADLAEERMMSRDACFQQPYVHNVKMGYWETSWPDTGDSGVVVTEGRYVVTGTMSYTHYGSKTCK
ncbi:hypothetical protein [Roseateles sp.]|uniref:hypothetical protein n=1 Tax=Roseateles sp. TaxID=1971397 RepID=UPI002F404836